MSLKDALAQSMDATDSHPWYVKMMADRFLRSTHAQSMDYHPKDVMITAMWLACKVEHYPHRFLEVEKVTLEDKKPFRYRSTLEIFKP